MDSPARGPVRLVRAAALAVVVLVLSVGAHVEGGGAPPGGRTVAGLLAVVAVPCWALARVRLSAPALVVVTSSTQLLGHHALAAGAPTSSAMAGAGMHATGAAGATGGTGGTPLVMLAAHAVATVVLSLLLAAGDGALWRLWSWLAPLRAPAPRARGALPVARAPQPAPLVVRPHPWVLGTAVPRRGPPVVLPG